MSVADVPAARLDARTADVRASAAVRGRTWRDLASIHHWLRGSGAVLIPAHSPQLDIDYTGLRTRRYVVEPSGRAVARVWHVAARLKTTEFPGSHVTVTFPDGGVRSLYPRLQPAPYGGDGATGITYVEELAAKSEAPETLTLEFVPTHDDTGYVIDSVACWELPRPYLTIGDPVDRGLEITSLRPNQPIYDDLADTKSAHAVIEALDGTEVRRHLVQMAFSPVSTTSSSLVPVFADLVPVAPRQLARVRAPVPVRCVVMARADVGTVSEYEIEELVDGARASVSVSGIGAWEMLDLGELLCWPEDPAQPDGDPAESIWVGMRRVSGTGTVSIAGVYVWESAGS